MEIFWYNQSITTTKFALKIFKNVILNKSKNVHYKCKGYRGAVKP